MNSSALSAQHIAIDNYDLSFLRERIADGRKLDGEDLAVVEREFKRFMKLVLQCEGPLAVIDPRVDELWHSFILFTPEYERFCHDVMGFFVHHQPRTTRTPIPERAISNFLEAYAATYGRLDEFWLEKLDGRLKDSIAAGHVPADSAFRWSGWTGRPERKHRTRR